MHVARPGLRSVAVQTDGCSPVARELDDADLAAARATQRSGAPRQLRAEVLYFVGYLLELLIAPGNMQLRLRLRLWQQDLQALLAPFRAPWLFNLAVFGLRL